MPPVTCAKRKWEINRKDAEDAKLIDQTEQRLPAFFIDRQAEFLLQLRQRHIIQKALAIAGHTFRRQYQEIAINLCARFKKIYPRQQTRYRYLGAEIFINYF